jgi:hypothetical protein
MRIDLPRSPMWSRGTWGPRAVVVAAAAGLLATVRLVHQPLLAGVLTAGLALLIVVPCAVAWKHYDEAMREAHKTGWFWGGVTGIACVFGMVIWAQKTPALSLEQFAHGHGDAGILAAGVALCLVAQCVGYVVFWAGWWISKR